MKTEALMLQQGDINCPVHINPELEILLVESGTVTVEDTRSAVILSAGEGVLIFPHQIHKFSCDETAKATVFMFSYSLAEEFCNRFQKNSPRLQKIAFDTETLSYIHYTMVCLEKQYDFYTVKSLFYAMVSAFRRKLHEMLPASAQDTFEIEKAIEYLFFHLDEDLSLEKLANHFNINKSSFGRCFKETTEVTFGEFLRNVRIEKSKSLLLKNVSTITEIAYECGFGSVRSFNRAFVEVVGCTPTEFRRR